MELALDYTLGQLPPPLHPLILIVGLPRPQSARQILRDATTLGVEELCFTITEKGEKSYVASRLWSGKEYERHLIAGAQQAFSTRIPSVRLFDSLAGCLESLPPDTERIALDNYEAKGSLSGYPFSPTPCALAVGSERGWARGERLLLIKHGFTLAAMGERVLRTETACTAGIILVLAGKGLI